MAQQPTVNARLVDEAIRHAHTLGRFGAGLAWKAADKVQRELVPALVAEIARLDGLGKPSERLRQTLVACNRLVNETMHGWRDSQKRDMRDFALTEAEWQRRVLRDALPFNYSFALPGKATLDALTDKPVVGKNLDAWYGDMARATKRGVEQSLRVGLAAGDSIPQLAARIRQGPGQLARRSAAMIARTSANDVSARAREATYAANRDVVKGVQIVATLDARTSPICQSEDGEVYPVGAGPRPPFHPFCRTTTVPVLESWEKFGVDPARVPEATRASMSGQVPERVKYGDWLRSQSATAQDKVLGPTRGKLFREGKLPIDKFVNSTGKPLTLDQLKAKLAEKPAVPAAPATPKPAPAPKPPKPVLTPAQQAEAVITKLDKINLDKPDAFTPMAKAVGISGGKKGLKVEVADALLAKRHGLDAAHPAWKLLTQRERSLALYDLERTRLGRPVLGYEGTASLVGPSAQPHTRAIAELFASRAEHRLTAAGVKLEVLKRDADAVWSLAQFNNLPDAVLRGLGREGYRVVVSGADPYTKSDAFAYLRGVTLPVEGQYGYGGVQDHRRALIGIDGPPANTTAHEVGHAVDLRMLAKAAPSEQAAWKQLADASAAKFGAYVRSYATANHPHYYLEAFADAFGDRYTFGRAFAVQKYGEPIVNAIEAAVARLP